LLAVAKSSRGPNMKPAGNKKDPFMEAQFG
jgi:hypothetical protein